MTLCFRKFKWMLLASFLSVFLGITALSAKAIYPSCERPTIEKKVDPDAVKEWNKSISNILKGAKICKFVSHDGCLLTEIIPNGPFDQIGIQSGDRIKSSDAGTPKNSFDIFKVFTHLESKNSNCLRVVRESQEIYIKVEVN